VGETEPTVIQRIEGAISLILGEMQENRPSERGETSRRWAIAITELEKVYAYWHTYLVEIEQQDLA
jgi:hypothetical protein